MCAERSGDSSGQLLLYSATGNRGRGRTGPAVRRSNAAFLASSCADNKPILICSSVFAVLYPGRKLA